MKKIYFLLTAVTAIFILATNGFANEKFNDIKNHWAETVIAEMAEKGIVKGLDDGRFAPDNSISRSEFLVLIHRMLDIEICYFAAPDIEKIFTDVKNNDWFGCNIYDLVTVGIIDDKEVLRPNEKITRQEAVHYLIRAYNYVKFNDVNYKDGSTKTHNPGYRYVKDLNEVKDEYRQEVMQGYILKLVEGRTNDFFQPNGLLTRAEALVLMKRLDNVAILNDKGELNINLSYDYLYNGFEMRAEIINNSKKEVSINFNSGQQYNLILLDKNNSEIYNWADGRFFTQALTKVTLKHKDKKVFTELLSYAEYKDIIDKAVYLKLQIPGKRSDGKEISEQIVEIRKPNN